MQSRRQASTPVALLRRELRGEVLRAATTGDRAAFDHVYDQVFPIVWRASLRRARGSRADAERIAAHTLRALVVALDEAPAPRTVRPSRR